VFLVFLDTGQQVANQGVRSFIFLAQQLEHFPFLDGAYGTRAHRDRRGHPEGIPRQANFSKKIMRAQDRGHRRRLALRSRAKPHTAVVNVEKRKSRLTLRVDFLFVSVMRHFSAQAGARFEYSQRESRLLAVIHDLLR